LALVRPTGLLFVSQSSFRGSPQARARFTHRGNQYNLAITDPAWEFQIAGRQPGTYPPDAFGLRADRAFLTISLGEPFDGFCYKLVAAIFELPGS